MDQAAMQVLHHMKTDLDLFLIDLKYIQNVVAEKLSSEVSVSQFNLVLSELSSVNAPLRRPTVACICRTSAVTSSSQMLHVNVDNGFFDRFFGVFAEMALSQEDQLLIEKAKDACNINKKVPDKDTDLNYDEYFEKYDDDDFDEDSQSKDTFEHNNLKLSSCVEDSLCSDATFNKPTATSTSRYNDDFESSSVDEITAVNTKDINVKPHDLSDEENPDSSSNHEANKNVSVRFSSMAAAKDSHFNQSQTLSNMDYSADFEENPDIDQHEKASSSQDHIPQNTEDAFIARQYGNEDNVEDSVKGSGDESAVKNADNFPSQSQSLSNLDYSADFEENPDIEYGNEFENGSTHEQDGVSSNDVNVWQNATEEKTDTSRLNIGKTIGSKDDSKELTSMVDSSLVIDSDNLLNEKSESNSATSQPELKDSFWSNKMSRSEHSNNSNDFDENEKNQEFNGGNTCTNTSANFDPQNKALIGTGDNDSTAPVNSHVSKDDNDVDSTNSDRGGLQINTNIFKVDESSDDDIKFPDLNDVLDSARSSTSDDISALPSSPDSSPTMSKYGAEARRNSMLNFLRAFSSPDEGFDFDEKKEDESEEHTLTESKEYDNKTNKSEENSIVDRTCNIPIPVSIPKRESDDHHDNEIEQKHSDDSHCPSREEENEGNTVKESKLSIMEAYALKPRQSAIVKNYTKELFKPKVTAASSSRPTSAKDRSSLRSNGEMSRPSSAREPSLQNISMSTTQSSPSPTMHIMEKYSMHQRSSSKFIEVAKDMGKSAVVVSKFSRPHSAKDCLYSSSTIAHSQIRPTSANDLGKPRPKSPIIRSDSKLLSLTKSMKQEPGPASQNSYSRPSGTMARTLSTEPSKHQSKYAERLLAVQQAAYTFEKKPPIPLQAFANCVKPANKGHVFDSKDVPKKPRIPVEAFAGCIKPENPGHVFDPPEEKKKNPPIPFNEFVPPEEKKLPAVDESKPVKNLKSLHKLVKNKSLVVEELLNRSCERWKDETYYALHEKYYERQSLHEKELSYIARTARNVSSSPTTVHAKKTIELVNKQVSSTNFTRTRPLTQDHADWCKSLIEETKKAAFNHSRHCMDQAKLRQEKELKALEASLREPTNRIRKYFDTQLFALNQAMRRANITYDHFRNMMDVLESNSQAPNRETQQARVHQAATECHTILFCCLDTVNSIDKEAQDLKNKLDEFLKNDDEAFNFSAANTVHFFPAQFHSYFKNSNFAHVDTNLVKRKTKRKKKHERNDSKKHSEYTDTFVTQQEDNGEDDITPHSPTPEKKDADWNKVHVIELLAKWLETEVEGSKSAQQWVNDAIATHSQPETAHILDNNDICDITEKIEKNAKHADLIISCLSEWLSEGLHTQDDRSFKSAKQWMQAAEHYVSNHEKRYSSKKKKKAKLKVNPRPCTECDKQFRGKGKILPSKLECAVGMSHAEVDKDNVHFLPWQKTQGYKYNNGRSCDKLFCSWNCARKWNGKHTPLLYRRDTDQLIRIAAGKFN